MSPNIRVATPDDADAIAAIYAPYVRDTVISFEWEPPDTREIRRRVEYTLEQYPWLVHTDGDGVAGYAYASQFRSRAAYQWSAEVSVYVDPRAQRRGIGNALYDALFGLLRRQGYAVLYGVITLPNEVSVKLHERAGFASVGVLPKAGYKLGTWCDVLYMRLELQALGAHPAPPVPFRQFAAAAPGAPSGGDGA